MLKEMRKRGVLTRVKGESVLFAPPLIVEPAQVDRIISALEESILAVCGV
jgi:adenosylmethionine-8-amino-7-oxononanoate aminotransferase